MSCTVALKKDHTGDCVFKELEVHKVKGVPVAKETDDFTYCKETDAEDILELWADGEELLYIFRNFQDIPTRVYNGKQQKWSGVFAQFIAMNW